MTLNKQDKLFILKNRQILISLFSRRINELRNEIFSMTEATQERDDKIRFVQEYVQWLKAVKIVEKESELEPNEKFI